jgi:1,2-diacylglycerol 3-alpha-glucosyltransferase
MNIGIITNSYPPNLNGVAVAVKNLEAALTSRGIGVFIVTPKVPGVVYPRNVLPILSLQGPTKTASDLRLAVSYKSKPIIKFLQANKVDLIHSQDTFTGAADAIMVASNLSIPCVHTYHTLIEDYGYVQVPGYKFFVRNFTLAVCNNNESVIVLSDKIKKYLTKLGVQVPMVSIPNIFIPNNSQPSQEVYSKVYKFIYENNLQGTYNILNFGRVAREKNIKHSIDKLYPLLMTNDKLRFVVMGNGPIIDELQEYIDELELTGKVIFYGKYSYPEAKIMSGFSKFFYTTSTTEVQPTTPLEAMSFGLPVICINDLAYRYLLRSGFNGYSIKDSKITETLIRVVSDHKLLKRLSRNATETYTKYLSTDVAQQYVDYYTQVIHDYKPKSIPRKMLDQFIYGSKQQLELFDLTINTYWKNFNKFGLPSNDPKTKK